MCASSSLPCLSKTFPRCNRAWNGTIQIISLAIVHYTNYWMLYIESQKKPQLSPLRNISGYNIIQQTFLLNWHWFICLMWSNILQIKLVDIQRHSPGNIPQFQNLNCTLSRTFILGKQNRSFKRINLNILIKITDFYNKKLDALKPVLRPESDVQLHIRCTKLSELSSW